MDSGDSPHPSLFQSTISSFKLVDVEVPVVGYYAPIEEVKELDSLVKLFYWRMTQKYDNHQNALEQSQPIHFPFEIWLHVMEYFKGFPYHIHGFSLSCRFFRIISIPVLFHAVVLDHKLPVQMACALSKAKHILRHIHKFTWYGQQKLCLKIDSPARALRRELQHTIVVTALIAMKNLRKVSLFGIIPPQLYNYIKSTNQIQRLKLSYVDPGEQSVATSGYTHISDYRSERVPVELFISSYDTLKKLKPRSLPISRLFETWKDQPPPHLTSLDLTALRHQIPVDSIRTFLINAIQLKRLALDPKRSYGTLPARALPILEDLSISSNKELLHLLFGRPITVLDFAMKDSYSDTILEALTATTKPIKSFSGEIESAFLRNNEASLLSAFKYLTYIKIHVLNHPGSAPKLDMPAILPEFLVLLDKMQFLHSVTIVITFKDGDARPPIRPCAPLLAAEIRAMGTWLNNTSTTIHSALQWLSFTYDSSDLSFTARRIGIWDWKIEIGAASWHGTEKELRMVTSNRMGGTLSMR